MQATQAENQKNNEAESACIRRTLWGEQSSENKADDDMGTTILGDVTHPTPIVINQQPQQSNSMLPIVAAGLIGLLGGGAGAAATAYMLSQKPDAQVQAFDDETVTIGLGRASDYLKDEVSQ